LILRSRRLQLVAGALDLATVEISDRAAFALRLGARVPEDWPPETLRDALSFFLDLYTAHPDWIGWLGWYAIRTDGPAPVLCGSVGFKGGPDAAGMVETGYSILPAHQRQGLASEMLAALLAWAWRQPGVRRIEAETTPDNLGSLGVLAANGFVACGPGLEPGGVRYRIEAAR
jgi:RimJ/RimL family protein N-acetyltransferase